MRWLSIILGSVLVLALALPASAATVDRYRVPTIAMADEGCGFLVEGVATINNEYETDIYNNDGDLVKILVTGHAVASLDNPANGKTIVQNASGSLHIDFVKGTFVLVGQNVFFSHLFDGRLDLTDRSFTGHISDEICHVSPKSPK